MGPAARLAARAMGLEGVIRGKPIRTTVSDKAAPCPLDHVNRQFRASAPNTLWVSDFTYVATWTGFIYVAFVIDTYAPDRRLAGEPEGACQLRPGRIWNRLSMIGGPRAEAGSYTTAIERRPKGIQAVVATPE
jgi:hypothetical protein